MWQCHCLLLSDRITSIDEQIDAFDSDQRDMDDVYHCNIKKLFNEIQQLGKRVYSARNEEEPTIKSEDEEGKCAFVSLSSCFRLIIAELLLFIARTMYSSLA